MRILAAGLIAGAAVMGVAGCSVVNKTEEPVISIGGTPGGATPGAMSLSASSLDFGSADCGGGMAPANKTVTITNGGSSDLHFSASIDSNAFFDLTKESK